MDNLEYFFDQKLKIESFYPRKLSLPEDDSFLLYGARGVGKSSLIVDYLNSTKREYLYIDAQDPVFVFDDIDPDSLNSFLEEEGIELLVIDHFFEGFLVDVPTVKQLILISREEEIFDGLESYRLLPLDYEEFLGFDRFHSPESAFTHFLKLGTLPKVAKGSIYEIPFNLRESFLEKFDEMEARLLLILAKFHSRRATTHQIYTTAKEYFKISKDWIYKTIKKFEREGVIYFFDEALLKGAKKMVIYDFTLAKYLNKNIQFTQIFDSTISLALFKHRFEFSSLGNFGYLIKTRARLISPAPFESKEQSIKRFKAVSEKLRDFEIKSVAIVTVSSRFDFTIDGVSFEALPFYEWTVVND